MFQEVSLNKTQSMGNLLNKQSMCNGTYAGFWSNKQNKYFSIVKFLVLGNYSDHDVIIALFT